MAITLLDFVNGKADLAFGSYGVPKPIYSVGTSEGATKGWDTRGRGRNSGSQKSGDKHFAGGVYIRNHTEHRQAIKSLLTPGVRLGKTEKYGSFYHAHVTNEKGQKA